MNARRLTLTLAAWGAACASPPDRLDALFNDALTVLDLSHALTATMPVWGGGPNPFVHDTLNRQPSGAPSMAAYSVPEHHGTHVDAPIHFRDRQASVDEILVRDLFGPAVVIDVAAAAATDPGYEVSRADVERWEDAHGTVPSGAVVLMFSGWDQWWNDPDRYFGRDADGGMRFPGFSEAAARMLVHERNVAAIGVDTPSVDPGHATEFPAHLVANGAGRYHLENVARLGDLPATGAYLIVAPIKIKGGSGGQARIFAVVPD